MGKSIDINAHLVESHAEGDGPNDENGYEEQVPDPSRCAVCGSPFSERVNAVDCSC